MPMLGKQSIGASVVAQQAECPTESEPHYFQYSSTLTPGKGAEVDRVLGLRPP